MCDGWFFCRFFNNRHLGKTEDSLAEKQKKNGVILHRKE